MKVMFEKLIVVFLICIISENESLTDIRAHTHRADRELRQIEFHYMNEILK